MNSGKLVFRMGDQGKMKANIPYPKDKVPKEVDTTGEDAFSMSPNGITVCDGVGGYAFSSFYASAAITLASQHYYADQLHKKANNSQDLESNGQSSELKDRSESELAIESFVSGLERKIAIYNGAIGLVLTKYLKKEMSNAVLDLDSSIHGSHLEKFSNLIENPVEVKIEEVHIVGNYREKLEDPSIKGAIVKETNILAGSQDQFLPENQAEDDIWSSTNDDKSGLAERLPNLSEYKSVWPMSSNPSEWADAFVSIVHSKNPLVYFKGNLPLSLNSNSMRQILSVGATTISASLNQEDDTLFAYKKGDSLMMAMRFKSNEENDLYLEPYYMMHDFPTAFNTPNSIKLDDAVYTPERETSKESIKLMGRKNEFTDIDQLKVKAKDVILIGSDGIFDNLPASVIVILANACLKKLIEYKNSNLSVESFETEADRIIVDVLADFVSATSDEEKVKASRKNLLKLSYLQPNHKVAFDLSGQENLSKTSDADDLSGCSIMDIFYVKFARSFQTDSSLLSLCVQSLITRHYTIGTSDFSFASEIFNVEVVTGIIAKATKVYTHLSELVELHNWAAKIYKKTAQYQSKKEDLTTQMKQSSKLISDIAGKLALELDANPNKINFNVDLLDSPNDSHRDIENQKEDKSESGKLIAELTEKFSSLIESQKKRVSHAKSESESAQDLIYLESQFNNKKNELIQKRLMTESDLSLALNVAAKARFVLHKFTGVEMNYEPLPIQRMIMSVFDIHSAVFDSQISKHVSISGSVKPDDITVVVTILDEINTEEVPSQNLQSELEAKARKYMIDLINSTMHWLNRGNIII